jgi:hypothetical protein
MKLLFLLSLAGWACTMWRLWRVMRRSKARSTVVVEIAAWRRRTLG